MASTAFNIPEEAHVVNILPPVDINGGAVDSDYFSLKDYARAQILITLGVTGAATTITVEENTDNSGTGATAIPFAYYAEETDAGDTLGDRTAATTSGFAASTNDNIMYLIDITAEELSDGSPWLNIHLTDPSAATLVSAVAVLTGARYSGPDGGPSAI